MPNVGQTFIEIEADKRSIAKYNRTLKGLENDSKNSAKKIESSFTSSFAKVAGAAIALRGAFNFVVAAKNAARDAEEIESKFLTVFESIQDKANETSKNLARDFGLANSSAQKLLGATGDLLVGFGFSEESALDLSKQVNELAVDLASFSNFAGGAEGASEALTKALLGETESAKSLGIVIRQNNKEFRDQVKQTAKARGISEQQAKSIVILGQAYRQSSKAVGDFARTQDSLANQERTLGERFKEIQEQLGKEVVPTFKALLGVISNLSTEVTNSSATFSTFGSVIKIIGSLVIGFVGVAQTLANTLGTIGAVVAKLFTGEFSQAFTAAEIGFNKILKDNAQIEKAFVEIWGSKIPKSVTNASNSISNATNNISSDVKKVDDELQKLLDRDVDTTGKDSVFGVLLREARALREESERIAEIRGLFGADTSAAIPTEAVDVAPKPPLEEYTQFDNLLDNVGLSAQRATQNLSSGFARAIIQGKSLNSVLNDTLALFAQMALTSLFSTIIGTATGGGSGLLGAIFGGESSSASPSTAPSGLSADIRSLQGSVRGLNSSFQANAAQPQVISINLGDNEIIRAVIDPSQKSVNQSGFVSDTTT